VEQIPLKFEFNIERTFTNFLPFNNQETVTHLNRVALNQGEKFIFLCGDPGHGKSHLLLACCHTAFHQKLRTMYLDLADPSMNIPDIFLGLEDYDLVCIDNIDSICSHHDIELAFFHFFNRHQQQHRNLIVSSQLTPTVLHFNLPDLSTRMHWGLTLFLRPLSDQDKIDVLRFKARQQGLVISPQAARYLLTRHDRSLTNLWLTLDKLDHASLAAHRKLTIPFLKQTLDVFVKR
jgi:DnaA family protein